MTGMGKGVDAFFAESDEAQESERKHDDKAVSQHADIQVKQQTPPDLKRATFYIRPNQDIVLDELKIRLRKQKVNTNKSELIREAIDLLAEQDIQALADRLTSK
jgi:hypothetical protein